MTSNSDWINKQFSLESLAPLDAADPSQMAEFILGVYTINTQGLQTCQQRLDEVAPAGSAVRSAADLLAELTADKNLSRTYQLLGNRTLRLTALTLDTQPIRYKGLTSAVTAAGKPDPYSKKLHGSDIGTLRIFKDVPSGRRPDLRTADWWDARIVDEALQPQVLIEVDPRVLQRRTAPSKLARIFGGGRL